jgi:radical SAM modification target selenobiotic family peptide
MDPKELKKILAGMGIATLISAVGATAPVTLHAGSS